MQEKLFHNLGIGVGLRPNHYSEFTSSPPPSVQWVEVVTENYLDWEDRAGGKSRQTLEKVRAHLPVALHGVSMSLGSSDPLNENYLRRLSTLVDAIEPVIVSDHLCWTGLNGRNFHDLLPLPFTEEALVHVADRIRRVQDFLGRRIAIENVSSYVQFRHVDMPEWEFLAEISRRADCGILLDVNNVYVSSQNHGFDAEAYISAIPKERVAQVHLAGHRKKGNILIDTHDEPVCPEVWDLYRFTVSKVGAMSAMIERDDAIPEWRELEDEILMLRAITDESRKKAISYPVSATV